jgi:hypothetical protein
MQLNFWPAAFFLMGPAVSPAALLRPSAGHAFDTYTAGLELRLAKQHAIRSEPVSGGSWQVPGGLIHDWRAGTSIPGARAQDMLALLRDYGHLAAYYAPEVVSSRAIQDSGAAATVAMRFRKQKVVTVVLDAEFETRSGLTVAAPAAGRGYSFSRSTHIWQVDRPDSAQERRRPEGDDDGFLWRLNSYWNFEETPEGLRIECEAVSLTRDVPAGLGWLIMPVVESLPQASLEFTLTATRNALAANARRNHDRAN